MKALLEEIKKLEDLISKAEDEYAAESIALMQTKGFDFYKKKWDKKADALANKYAGIIYPLKEKHNELVEKYNEKSEEKRKKLYKSL